MQICICAGSERRRSGEGSCRSSWRSRPRKYRLEQKYQLYSRYKNAFIKESRVYAKKTKSQFNNQALEAALRSLSYDTLVKVKESIAREAACRELERQGGGEGGDGDGEAGRRDREVEEQGAVTSRPEERPNLPPSPHSPPHSRPSPGLPQYSLSSQV